MKKTLPILLVLIGIIIFSGCANLPNVNTGSSDVATGNKDVISEEPANPPAASGTAITLDEAKAAALAKAGLAENQVTFTKTAQDWDDGRTVYEIEFVSGDMEYEVEVNTENGNINEYSAESIYND